MRCVPRGTNRAGTCNGYAGVLPAVEAGMRAVWIEALNAPHELKKAELPKGAYSFTSLLELARHIEKHGDLDVKAAANTNTSKPSAKKAFGGPRC